MLHDIFVFDTLNFLKFWDYLNQISENKTISFNSLHHESKNILVCKFRPWPQSAFEAVTEATIARSQWFFSGYIGKIQGLIWYLAHFMIRLSIFPQKACIRCLKTYSWPCMSSGSKMAGCLIWPEYWNMTCKTSWSVLFFKLVYICTIPQNKDEYTIDNLFHYC